jgi:hypothetical protein
MRIRTTPLLFTALLLATPSFAYVQILHEEITQYAFELATQNSDFLSRYKLTPISILLEQDMKYGANHEDDLPRSLHHFADPQNSDTGLTVRDYTIPEPPVCTQVGYAADFWALDSPRPVPGDEESIFYNGYGLDHAHHQMYDMLAGATPGDRSLAAERLFEDLGHIVHLLQDMGQPEHARNDQHLALPGGYGITGLPIKSAASIYENWTRDNIALQNIVHSAIGDTPAPAFFTGYAPLRFSDYHTYFTNGTAGLADYSTNNHVTQDTNYKDDSFHCFVHASPSESYATPRDETIIVPLPDPVTLQIEQKPVVETVYSLDFYDYATGQPNRDGYHTIESFYSHETTKYGSKPVHSLSEESWFTRAANLLPKTVGYSAGLLQRFFRGQITSSWLPQSDGTYTVHMTNVTPMRFADPLTNCTIELYQITDLGDAVRLAPPASFSSCQNDTVVATGIPSSPTDPIYTHELRVVARGDLGGEQGAVIGQILPKRHTLKLVYQYNPAVQYQVNYLQLTTTDYDQIAKDGWFTCTTRCVGTTIYAGSSFQFGSAAQPPFTGTFQITVGVADDDVFYGEVNLRPLTDNVSVESATLTVYRDGAQVNQMTFGGASSLFDVDFTIDANGNISNIIHIQAVDGHAKE